MQKNAFPDDKVNKLYQTFYKQRVFTLEEASALTKNKQVAKNAIQRLMKKRLVKRIKQGLYHIVPLDNEGYIPEPILIASKLRKKFFFSHLTALQIHDLMESSIIFMGCDKKQEFTLHKTDYQFMKAKHFGTEERIIGNQKILVSDMERTFLDCMDNLDLFRDVDEFVSIMSNAKINSNKVLDHLKKYRKKKLYHFAGYFMERMKEFLNPDPRDLSKIQRKLSNKVYYLQVKPKSRYSRLRDRLTKGRPKYNNRWRIIVSE